MNPITINVHVTIEAPALVEALGKLVGGVAVTAAPRGPQQLEFDFDQKAQEEQKKVDEVLDLLYCKQKKAEPTPVEPEESEETPAPAAEAETYTVEEVRAALANLSKMKGRETAKAILTALGVKSVSNLQPEQFAEAMQMIKEA